MTAPAATMWQTYRYRGVDVVVIQKWHDPFGIAMVRIEEKALEGSGAGLGLTEADFMQSSGRPARRTSRIAL